MLFDGDVVSSSVAWREVYLVCYLEGGEQSARITLVL